MPAYSPDVAALAVKVVSVVPANAGRGLPTVPGVVLLIDVDDGRPVALIDGTYLTHMRTGAAIGLAADLLARADAESVALFGIGATAQTSLRATCAVRKIQEVRVVHPHAERFPAFAAAMRDRLAGQPRLTRYDSPQQAVQDASIVITATTSATPVFPGEALAPGAFVGALGAFRPTDRELDDETIRRSRVVVDLRAASLAEAGDLAIPIASGLIAAGDIWAEIGEILAGTRPGRSSPDENFVFKSVGNASQDLALAARIYEQAQALGLGRDVSL
jgi:ornithine cyclodeaminase/alanine dehydrogenase-like protein (mu-crystallin family)